MGQFHPASIRDWQPLFYSNLEKYKIKGLIFSGYLLDETDPSLTQGVFFEVRLELSEPDVIFVPHLDKNLVGNFYDQQDFCPKAVQKSHQVQTVQV